MEQNKKADKLLEVRDLQVSFFTPAGEVKAVNGISYDVNYNEVMGVVGESGSGKSVEAYSDHRPVTESRKSNRWFYHLRGSGCPGEDTGGDGKLPWK